MAAANPGISENAIELITADGGPHYEPFGWHHWPEHPCLAYQFCCGLGDTQEGGGSVSKVMQAGARMIPGDLENWHTEWMRIADRNWARGLAEEAQGHIRTAMNCFLRAADYYRQAEFHLEPNDVRLLPTFEGHLEHMRCPYLVLHGGHGVLTATAARSTYDYAKTHGVDATMRVLDPEETGAEHCQHDNPTIGQEVLADWLADRFGIDQRTLKTSFNSPI
jgi:hypothetical protein